MNKDLEGPTHAYQSEAQPYLLSPSHNEERWLCHMMMNGHKHVVSSSSTKQWRWDMKMNEYWKGKQVEQRGKKKTKWMMKKVK